MKLWNLPIIKSDTVRCVVGGPANPLAPSTPPPN